MREKRRKREEVEPAQEEEEVLRALEVNLQCLVHLRCVLLLHHRINKVMYLYLKITKQQFIRGKRTSEAKARDCCWSSVHRHVNHIRYISVSAKGFSATSLILIM